MKHKLVAFNLMGETNYYLIIHKFMLRDVALKQHPRKSPVFFVDIKDRPFFFV